MKPLALCFLVKRDSGKGRREQLTYSTVDHPFPQEQHYKGGLLANH